MKVSFEDKAYKSGAHGGEHSGVAASTEQQDFVWATIKRIKEKLGPDVQNMVEVLVIRFRHQGDRYQSADNLHFEMKAVLAFSILGTVHKVEVYGQEYGYSVATYDFMEEGDEGRMIEWMARDFVSKILGSLWYYRGELEKDASRYIAAVASLEKLCAPASAAVQV